jgi:hypothetical protein
MESWTSACSDMQGMWIAQGGWSQSMCHLPHLGMEFILHLFLLSKGISRLLFPDGNGSWVLMLEHRSLTLSNVGTLHAKVWTRLPDFMCWEFIPSATVLPPCQVRLVAKKGWSWDKQLKLSKAVHKNYHKRIPICVFCLGMGRGVG